MINAKDTFYLMLRDRLAALNPTRIFSLRGVSRPGLLVEENELATVAAPLDVFRLRWTALTVETAGPLPLAAMTCEIRYATEGTAVHAGTDRGRLLAAMDAELSAALRTPPCHVAKQSYSAVSGAAPTPLATSIFWSDAVFAAATTTSEQLARTVTVEVFAYQEAGE